MTLKFHRNLYFYILFHQTYVYFLFKKNEGKYNQGYFFFSNIQNIKSYCHIIFFKRFPVIYFCRIIYSFPLIFTYKWFDIETLCGYNIKSIYYLCLLDLLLLFTFLSILENQYMNYHV